MHRVICSKKFQLSGHSFYNNPFDICSSVIFAVAFVALINADPIDENLRFVVSTAWKHFTKNVGASNMFFCRLYFSYKNQGSKIITMDSESRKVILRQHNRFRNKVAKGKLMASRGLQKAARMGTVVKLNLDCYANFWLIY